MEEGGLQRDHHASDGNRYNPRPCGISHVDGRVAVPPGKAFTAYGWNPDAHPYVFVDL